jgi:hypothetical protein
MLARADEVIDSDHKNALFYRVAGCRRHPICGEVPRCQL